MYVCLILGNLPKKESEWRRGRSFWSFADSSRLRESSPDTWNGYARQVSINSTVFTVTLLYTFCSKDIPKLVEYSPRTPKFAVYGIIIFRNIELCNLVWFGWYSLIFVTEEVLLAEEDQNAEEKSPLDGAWYKKKQNSTGEKRARVLVIGLP